jgi:hypothetical protein
MLRTNKLSVSEYFESNFEPTSLADSCLVGSLSSLDSMLGIIPLLKAIPISEQRIKTLEPKNVSPDGSSPFSAIREAAIRAEDVKNFSSGRPRPLSFTQNQTTKSVS